MEREQSVTDISGSRVERAWARLIVLDANLACGHILEPMPITVRPAEDSDIHVMAEIRADA